MSMDAIREPKFEPVRTIFGWYLLLIILNG